MASEDTLNAFAATSVIFATSSDGKLDVTVFITSTVTTRPVILGGADGTNVVGSALGISDGLTLGTAVINLSHKRKIEGNEMHTHTQIKNKD